MHMRHLAYTNSPTETKFAVYVWNSQLVHARGCRSDATHFSVMMVDLTEEVIIRSRIVRILFKLMIRVARGDHIVAAGED